MSFSKIFQIHFIVDSTFIFFFIPVCLNNSWWCFSLSFSSFEDRRRVFLHILPHSRKSSHNCFWLWESFSPIRSISRVFQFAYPKAIISGLFILTFQISFSNSYRCITQVSFNQLAISSFNCILIPSSIFVLFLFFPVSHSPSSFNFEF